MAEPGTDVAESSETDIVPVDDALVATPDTELIEGAFDEEHGHPGPRQYVLIAVVLCVLTAIEVGCYYLEGDLNDNLLIAMLWVLAAREVLPRRRVVHAHADGRAVLPAHVHHRHPPRERSCTASMLLTFASTVLSS